MAPLGAARALITGGVLDLGKLELIETQTTSSAVSTVDFDSIKESEYNVHFMTISNIMSDTGTDELVMRFKVSGSAVSSGYRRAQIKMRGNGTVVEAKSTSYSSMRFSGYNTATGSAAISKNNSYLYIYDAGDSAKYTHSTHQTTGGENVSGSIHYQSTFGGNVLSSASTVNGIQFLNLFGSNITSNIIFSLYGLKEQ